LSQAAVLSEVAAELIIAKPENFIYFVEIRAQYTSANSATNKK